MEHEVEFCCIKLKGSEKLRDPCPRTDQSIGHLFLWTDTKIHVVKRILIWEVCCLSNSCSKSFQNHNCQTGCLNVRNSGTLHLLPSTLQRTSCDLQKHMRTTLHEHSKLAVLSTNCTHLCLLFNFDNNVGSFQISMSDAMGVQGFHPYRNSHNHIMERLLVFKHDIVHRCWWLWFGYGYKFKGKCWALLYMCSSMRVCTSPSIRSMRRACEPWTLSNTHWIQP
jgi:hypothetical protein